MAETPPALRAVDRLEVTILGDNSIDVFLPHENFRKRLFRAASVPDWLLKAVLSLKP
jgi:hypothetical protein